MNLRPEDAWESAHCVTEPARVFTGKGTLASDAEVVRYVGRTKRAIGYVSAAADTAGAKKIHIK